MIDSIAKREPWRKVRVVVEVPVRGTTTFHFRDKDLCSAVERALRNDGFWQDKKYLPKEHQPQFGRVLVKSFAKVVAAKT